MTTGIYRDRFWWAHDDRRAFAYDPHTHRIETIEVFDDPLDSITAFADEVADAEDTPLPDVRVRNRVRNLKLSLSATCNLDCSYCFRHSGIPELAGSTGDMSGNLSRDGSAARPAGESIAIRAIDAMVSDFGSDAPDYCIIFNLTSEPLLHWRLLDSLLSYTEVLSNRISKTIFWYVLTNGTILGPQVEPVMERLLDQTGRLVVSIDGPADVHDANRHYPDGTGSHAQVLEFIRKYRGRAEAMDAESVITPAYPYPWRVIEYLREMGFSKISTRPVRSEETGSGGFDALVPGYDELYAVLLDSVRRGDYSLFTALRHDHALRPLWRLLPGYKAVNRCFWGLTHVVVDALGRYYTCDGMIGREGWTVGSLEEGMKWEAFHQDVSVMNREPCRKCWARYACGGTCYLKGVDADGDPLTIDSEECRFNSYVVGRNLELMAEIMSHPGALVGAREAFIRN